jgi:ATP-dependent RNA helicase DHX29
MSATVDAAKISDYMGGCPVITVHGRTFPVTAYHLEDVVEMTDYKLDPKSDSPYINWRRSEYISGGSRDCLMSCQDAKKPIKSEDRPSDDEDDGSPFTLGPQYSQRTKTTIEILDEAQINYDLLMLLLEQVCIRNADIASRFRGAVLIFMPSLESIRRFTEQLEGHPTFGTSAFQLHPLHSSITSENQVRACPHLNTATDFRQSRVFVTPPPGIRKIVIATNIAELV